MLALALFWFAATSFSNEHLEDTKEEVYTNEHEEILSEESDDSNDGYDNESDSDAYDPICYDYSEYDIEADDEEEAPVQQKKQEQPKVNAKAPTETTATKPKPTQPSEDCEYVDDEAEFIEQSSDWETL